MRAALIAFAAVMAALTSGCASIVSGSQQSVSVETRQKGMMVKNATCKLNNNKGTWYVNSPGSVTVNRSYEDLAIQCEKEQYEPGIATVKSFTKGMMFGNILLGGIIGGAIDASTGAGYDYPGLIHVEMGEAITIEPPKPATETSSEDNPGTQPSAQPVPVGLTPTQ
jgi:hypothetical protein